MNSEGRKHVIYWFDPFALGSPSLEQEMPSKITTRKVVTLTKFKGELLLRIPQKSIYSDSNSLDLFYSCWGCILLF